MKRTLYLFLTVILLLSLCGCDYISSLDNDSVTLTNDINDEDEEADSDSENDTEFDSSSSINKNDLKVVGKYSYTNIIGDTEYFLVVKNNSPKTVEINSSVIAYNKKGEEVGVADGSYEDLPSGYEALIPHYFESTKNVNKFKYELEIENEKFYSPAIQDIKVSTKKFSDKVIIKCKNNGDDEIDFLEATVLFFKGKKLVYHDSEYLINDDFVIKPGKQITKQIESYKKFDNVKVYIAGRKS